MVLTYDVIGNIIYEARKQWAEDNTLNFTDEYEDYSLCVPEEKAIDFAESFTNLSYLDYGASRIVFSTLNDKVIKFARYGGGNRIHEGLDQNHRETVIWSKIVENNDQENIPVLPILENHENYYWVKQKRVTPLGKTHLNKEEKREIKSRIRSKVQRLGAVVSIYDIILGGENNMGLDSNDKGYLIDYGLEPDYNL